MTKRYHEIVTDKRMVFKCFLVNFQGKTQLNRRTITLHITFWVLSLGLEG